MIKAYKFYENSEHKAVIIMLLKAREIGIKAANVQFLKLQKAGPKWKLTDDLTGKSAGTILDVCGYAYMTIPGRGKIVKAFKKLGTKGQYNQEYILEDEHMRISKAYDRGYNLNLGLNIGRQEMSVNEEAVFAASEFLNNAGLECDWGSRID